MSSLDLDRLDAMFDAGTAGTWFYNSYAALFSAGCTITGIDGCGRKGMHPAPQSDEEDDDLLCTPVVGFVPADHGDTAMGRNRADAECIVELHNAYPELSRLARIGQEAEPLRAALSAIAFGEVSGVAFREWAKAVAGRALGLEGQEVERGQ